MRNLSEQVLKRPYSMREAARYLGVTLGRFAIFKNYGPCLVCGRDAEWEHHYNFDRFSLAPQGLTAADKLATFLSPLTPSSPNTPCTHSGAAD